jgi:hypothetical protein
MVVAFTGSQSTDEGNEMVDNADDYDDAEWTRLRASLGDRLRALVPPGWRPDASTAGLLLLAVYGFAAAAGIPHVDRLIRTVTAVFSQPAIDTRLSVRYAIFAIADLVGIAAEVVTAIAGLGMLAGRSRARVVALVGLATMALAIAVGTVDGIVSNGLAGEGLRQVVGNVLSVCGPIAVLAVVAWSRRQE